VWWDSACVIFLIVYLAHQTHQQSRSQTDHHTNGLLADTFHLHTETPQVGTEALEGQVHRAPHLTGQHSLDGHHNADPGSNMVHCRVGVNSLNSVYGFQSSKNCNCLKNSQRHDSITMVLHDNTNLQKMLDE